jgi:hypothetical protein
MFQLTMLGTAAVPVGFREASIELDGPGEVVAQQAATVAAQRSGLLPESVDVRVSESDFS